MNPPNKPLSFRVRAELYSQLAAMEAAGMPFDKALALLRLPHADQPRLKLMRSLLTKGSTLADAGEKSGVFTRLEASLLRVALNAGSPTATYRRLAKYYTQRAMQAMTIKSRLAMPVFALIAALFIQPLPGLITGQFSAGNYLLQCLGPLVVLAGVAYLFIALPHWLDRPPLTSFRFWIDQQRLHIPLFGAIHRRSNIRDFFESLALMLEAGIPMLDALPKALDTIHNSAVKQAFSGTRTRIEQGDTLAQAISALSCIRDNQITQFIWTGEESGTLPEMLFRYTTAETDSLHQFHQQITDWAPRLLYGLVMCWIAYGIVRAGSI